MNKYLPAFMSLKAIQPYFDVTSKDILQRLLFAFMFWNGKFYSEYHTKPDLYGPFWVLTTLIAMLFISGNVYRYIEWPDDSDEEFSYSFSVIPIAAGIIYGIGVGLPLLMKVMLNLYGTGEQREGVASVLSAIGIYGYSFTPFIIMSMFCGILPFDWAHWVLIVLSGVASFGFLWKNYWNDFKENLDSKLRWVAVGVICTVQVILLLLFKFYFFAAH